MNKLAHNSEMKRLERASQIEQITQSVLLTQMQLKPAANDVVKLVWDDSCVESFLSGVATILGHNVPNAPILSVNEATVSSIKVCHDPNTFLWPCLATLKNSSFFPVFMKGQLEIRRQRGGSQTSE